MSLFTVFPKNPIYKARVDRDSPYKDVLECRSISVYQSHLALRDVSFFCWSQPLLVFTRRFSLKFNYCHYLLHNNCRFFIFSTRFCCGLDRFSVWISTVSEKFIIALLEDVHEAFSSFSFSLFRFSACAISNFNLQTLFLWKPRTLRHRWVKVAVS